MKKIKIVVLGTRGFPGIQGGVEKHCEELYTRLALFNCEVIVFKRKSYFKKDDRIENWKGVKFIYLQSTQIKGFEAFFHTFYALLYSFFLKPDIIHFHAIGPSIFTPIAKIFGFKVIVTNHGPDYERSKWGKLAKIILKTGEFLGTKFADKVIVISKGIRNILIQKYNRKDVEVIPNGVFVSNENFSINTLNQYNLEPKKYIFTACRITPEKGIIDLINAYKKIIKPDFNLVIAGKTDSISKYINKIKSIINETDGIILTGFLTGKPLSELYYNAGLFVLPSYYEGLPIALLEALSYNLPVLVSDIPQNLEILLPEYRYFKTGSVDELSKKIPELLKLSISNDEKNYYKELLKTKYNWDIIAKQTLHIYFSLLNEN